MITLIDWIRLASLKNACIWCKHKLGVTKSLMKLNAKLIYQLSLPNHRVFSIFLSQKNLQLLVIDNFFYQKKILCWKFDDILNKWENSIFAYPSYERAEKYVTVYFIWHVYKSIFSFIHYSIRRNATGVYAMAIYCILRLAFDPLFTLSSGLKGQGQLWKWN